MPAVAVQNVAEMPSSSFRSTSFGTDDLPDSPVNHRLAPGRPILRSDSLCRTVFHEARRAGRKRRMTP